MAILTPKELLEHESPERVVDLGGGKELQCRLPDLDTLLYEGLMPMPLMSAVVKTVASWAGAETKDITADMLAKNEAMRTFVDKWVCAAMVSPRAVQPPPPPEDGSEPPPFRVPPDAVLVTSLTLATRAKVFKETFSLNSEQRQETAAKAERFPDVGPGAGSGPDVPAVPAASV
jgi:hypothetical protein